MSHLIHISIFYNILGTLKNKNQNYNHVSCKVVLVIHVLVEIVILVIHVLIVSVILDIHVQIVLAVQVICVLVVLFILVSTSCTTNTQFSSLS